MTDPPAPIRVFLLDDHEIVRRGIKELLEGEPDIEVVGESGLAEEAMRRIPALRPGRRDPRRPAAGRLGHRRVPRGPVA